MISLAISQTKILSLVELGSGAPIKGGEDPKGIEIGGFSAILAGLSQRASDAPAAPEGVAGTELAAAGQAGEASVTGEQAAAIAATGKFLPPILPVLAAPAGERGSDPQSSTGMADDGQGDAGSDGRGHVAGEVAPVSAALSALVALVVPDAAASPGTVPVSHTVPDTVSASTRPLPQVAATLPPAAGKDGEAAPAPLATARGEAAPAPSVAVHVAAQAGNDGDRPARHASTGEPHKAPERTAKPAAKAAPETASAQSTLTQPASTQSASTQPASPQSASAQSTLTQSASALSAPAQGAPTPTAPAAPVAGQAASGAERLADGAQPFAPPRPSPDTQVTRELGRIVDSLASAREALTARSATLAVSHDEFGALSLRFEQRRDGQLVVQLSAADPEAHRAVAAAVAERPAYAQSDTGGANGQPGQSASGGAGRGAAAERDGSGGGNHAARQDRGEQPQRGQARSETTGTGSKGRSGIYA